MDLMFKQLRVIIDLESDKKSLLEDMLPKGTKFKMARPIRNGLSEVMYAIKPVNEEEKNVMEKKLFLIGIKEFYFQG